MIVNEGGTHLIQKISEKGLPYRGDEDELCYGNLYVIYKVVFPLKLEDLKNLVCEEGVSGESDCVYDALNCEFDEIFNE